MLTLAMPPFTSLDSSGVNSCSSCGKSSTLTRFFFCSSDMAMLLCGDKKYHCFYSCGTDESMVIAESPMGFQAKLSTGLSQFFLVESCDGGGGGLLIVESEK